ncbi:MAG: alpha/beta hydrolase [Bacteroidales bacterium]|nr:alpha/beta hydrolase [Bacteroidales bacterium]MCM1415231.1 alpha/beta hydrolase [bacterium]MCM1423775.1 alpha/beta hydrolase [bacterium]
MKYIFLHGLGQKPSDWEETVKAADPAGEVICPDLFAWLHGKEPDYAVLYHAFEEFCGQYDEPLCLCGLSLGGILALQYAASHGERVGALILVGAQFTMPRRLLQVQNLIFSVLPDAAFTGMGLAKKSVIALSKSMMKLDFAQELQKIDCRTMIVCGKKDRANRKAALQMREKIPNAELHMVVGAGHEVNREKPEELGRILIAAAGTS